MVAHEILEIAQAQVQGQRTKDLDLGYGLTLDLICPHPPSTHHQFFCLAQAQVRLFLWLSLALSGFLWLSL